MSGSDKKTNISTLKTKLSYYLKYVQNGNNIVVFDRNLPVAKIVSYQSNSASEIKMISPIDNDTSLALIRGKKFTKHKSDILSLLLEDRESS